MDRLRAERQIKLVLATFRAERRRRDRPTMGRFLDRADAILGELEPRIQDQRDTLRMLRDARKELASGQRGLSRGRLPKQSIDRRGQLRNREGLQ